MDDSVDGTVLSGMDNVFAFCFPIVVCKEVLVDDSIDVGVMRGFDRGVDETRFVSFSVSGKGTDKFLGLVEGFFDGEGPLDPIDRGIDFLQPGESQDYIFISQAENVEGDSSGYSSNIKEQSSGEPDYPFGVNGVVCIPGLYWGLQTLGREFVFSNKPPVNARDACSAVNEGSGVNGFHCVRRGDKLNWDLHSR